MCVIPLEIDELIQLLLNTIWDCPFDDAKIEKSLILIPHNVALCQLYKNSKLFNSDTKDLHVIIIKTKFFSYLPLNLWSLYIDLVWCHVLSMKIAFFMGHKR